MSLAETLLLALALSMDAFAVSMAAGMSQKSCNFKKALILGATFGIFQALMPALGFFASAAAHIYISKIDHWIAFGLLAFIGAKMVSESLRSEENSHGYMDNLKIGTLLILGIATSIDALAVGVSLACLKSDLLSSITTIGITTFILSFFGVLFGSKIGQKTGKYAELLGGVVLIAIGLRIVVCQM